MKRLRTYTIGFVISILLTIEAYLVVTHHHLSGNLLVGCLLVLAITQLAIQMIFFLHLGEEMRPRWRLVAFSFMGLVVSILVVGTLWIMKNLDYNHMHNHSDQSIIQDEGVHP